MLEIIDQGDLVKFDKLFRQSCTCQIEHFKIPLIYGEEELHYAFLLNHLYLIMAYHRKEPSQENNLVKGTYYTKDKKNILLKSNNPFTSNKIFINNNNQIEDKEIITKEDQNTFENKCIYIKKLLSKILSNDFKECFYNNKKENINYYKCNLEEKSEMNSNTLINPLFLHLLFFDLVLVIISTYNINNDPNYCLDSLIKQFFETSKNKIKLLLKFKNIIQLYEIIDNDQKKKITLKENLILKNKNYILNFNDDINKENIIFNPFDFCFDKLFKYPFSDIDDFKNKIKDCEYFSFKKIFHVNRLFNDETIFKEYKKNINEMICSNIINACFLKIYNFKDFINPYKTAKKDDFLEQINQIIFYFRFPHNNIHGFTYRKLGLIFINSLFPKRKNSIKETKILKKICDVSIKKAIEGHEIIFHYTSIILHANSRIISIPKNSFITYYPKKKFEEYYSYYDEGDKRDCLLFGNKLTCLYLYGSLYILYNDNWENKKLDNFEEMFREINLFKEGFYSINEENNVLVKLIINDIKDKDNDKEELNNVIKLTEKNSKVNFRYQEYNDDEENEDEDEDEDNSRIFINRLSLCDNSVRLFKFYNTNK